MGRFVHFLLYGLVWQPTRLTARTSPDGTHRAGALLKIEMTEAIENLPTVTQWFALTVKHQHEKQIGLALRRKGLEELVPLYTSRRRWSDRVKVVELPLFPNYVFCHFSFEDRLVVLNIPGVYSVVGFGGRPTPVPDREIANIQAILASGLAVEPWPHLKAGDIVLIEDGPLRGVQGTLLETKDACRVVVSVEMLQRSIAVQLDHDALSLVRRASIARSVVAAH